MADKKSILLLIPEALKADLAASIRAKGKFATGRTIDELEAEATDSTSKLTAPAHITTLEKGRKPTRPNAPKGDPTLFESLKEWCISCGIDESAAWPISQHIHKYGFEGTIGVLTEPLSDGNVNRRIDESLGKLASIVTADFADTLNI